MEGLPPDLSVTLHRVFYVPQFNKKVISVPKLSEEGYLFTFRGRTCDVTLPNGGVLSVQCSCDNLYYLNVVTRQEDVWAIEDTGDLKPRARPVVNINDMHDKYGHLGETLLRKTLNHLGYEVRGTMKSCDACKMAKARAKGVKKKTEVRSEIPGQRMYIDITGPCHKSLGGSKYWVQVVDDAS